MARNRREYALGTYLVMDYPWGTYVTGAALCPDGKVRRLKRIAQTADTFFSVPAAVHYRGKTVAGYVSTETLSGSDVATEEDPGVVRFRPYLYGRNGHLFEEA